MSATCLRVFISDNRDGPFVELLGLVSAPLDGENVYEFLAHDNEEFRKAWNDVLLGQDVAAAVFLYKVRNMEKKFDTWIGPLYKNEGNGYLCGPIGHMWEVKQ